MLYDTKWQKYNYAGVYLPSFVAWLSTKPRDEEYNFFARRECAVAQYLQAIGYSKDESDVQLPAGEHWLSELVAFAPWDRNATFGALHDRARALMDSAND